jgi:laminin alpha 3/5
VIYGIYKPSLYRMVLRFVDNNPDSVIKITSDNPSDNEQEFQVQFKNTTSVPAFVSVSGATGNTPSPFVMNPGRWQISIKVEENLLLVA